MRNCGSSPEGRVLVRHLRLVHLSEALGDRLALVKLRENSAETACGSRLRLLLVDLEDRRRPRRRGWRRRRTPSRRRGRCRRGCRASERFGCVSRRNPLGIPWNTVGEVVLDIIDKVAEYLEVGLHPLNLLSIPCAGVSGFGPYVLFGAWYAYLFLLAVRILLPKN